MREKEVWIDREITNDESWKVHIENGEVRKIEKKREYKRASERLKQF